jgi:hypothetical protein
LSRAAGSDVGGGVGLLQWSTSVALLSIPRSVIFIAAEVAITIVIGSAFFASIAKILL